MDNFRFTKAKFYLTINTVEEREENGEKRLVVIKKRNEWCRGSDLERSFKEDYENNIGRKIEICEKEPEQFVLGTMYIRLDGKRAWVFNKDE